MKQMHVMYVIWSLGLGGAEQVVLHLARGLDKNRFRVSVCCLNDEGEFAPVLQQSGVKVFALHKQKGIDLAVVSKLRRIFKEQEVDLVHAHLWGGNFWGRIAAHKEHIPVVVTEHNVDVWKTPIHFFLDRMLYRKADKFLCVSDSVRQFYSGHLHVRKECLNVLYNGIETDENVIPSGAGLQLKSEFNIGENTFVFSIIGRLVPQKGHSFFLDVFKRIAARHPDVKVLIIGDGPLKQALTEQIIQNGLKDKVVLTGLRKDVPAILSITDAVVLPSFREGLPMTLLEGMVREKVVVASAVGGTPELVTDGVDGFLFEAGNAGQLEEKLNFVLSGGENLSNIRAAARRKVCEQFSLSNMIRQHEAVYQEMIK